MKNIVEKFPFKKVAAAAFLITLISVGATIGQTNVGTGASGSTGAGTGKVSTTVDTVEDQFVQFNNLRITKIKSSDTIMAVTDFAIPNPCVRFKSNESSTGTNAPCPMPIGTGGQGQGQENTSILPQVPPQIIYTITVTPETILMLRDRTRASFSDFAVNDRINVFGFYQSNNSIVQALILRNLSKPREQQFIQLNNVEVVSIPSDASLPAKLVAVQRIGSPCFGYGKMGLESSRPFPCPLGVKSFNEIPASGMPGDEITEFDAKFRPEIFRKHVIEITSRTILLNRNRNPITIDKIAIGDTLNVYGLYSEDASVVEALVLRDLSQPAAAETVSGVITAVNTDGTFVIRTDDGQEFSVKPPPLVGQRVEIRGFIDRALHVISNILHLSATVK